MKQITIEELEGRTYGPLEIEDFFNKDWKTLQLPNGTQESYTHPKKQDFFGTPRYTNGPYKTGKERGSFAHLNIIRETILKWLEKNDLTIENVLAVFVFGSSVRETKTRTETKGKWFWKKEIEVVENIHPQDVDILVVTDVDPIFVPILERCKLARLESKKGEIKEFHGSFWATNIITTMGLDINHICEYQFNSILRDPGGENKIPVNVVKEGVLLAGSLIDIELQSKRKVMWHERHKLCIIT